MKYGVVACFLELAFIKCICIIIIIILNIGIIFTKQIISWEKDTNTSI